MLAPSTVSNITSELIESGLVRRAGNIGSAGAGRRSEILSRNPSARSVAAVHITPERCIAGIVDLDYEVLASSERVFDEGFSEGDTPVLFQMMDELLERTGTRSRLSGISLAIPNHPYHLPTIEARFLDHFPRQPFFRINNTEAMAVHEYYLELGKRYRTVAYVYVGTGVGSGFIIDGDLYRGFNGNACDLGHMYMTDKPLACRCGRRGCLETVASERALSREVARRYGLERPPLREGLVDFLAARLRDNDAPCAQLIGEAAEYLGKGIFNLVSITDPQIVVVSGRLNALNPFFSSLVLESYMRRARNFSPALVPLEFLPLRREAGLVGAAMFAFMSMLCDVGQARAASSDVGAKEPSLSI
jgi:predicted NBD/HSP70 family sugar kinase